MKENKKIKKAQEELEYLTGDEAERRLAFLREKKIRDDISYMNGKIREGKQEIATNMLKEGASVEFIQKVTGLTKEQLEKIPEYAKRDEFKRIAELKEKKILDDLWWRTGERKEGERNKSIEIAKKMLIKGTDIDFIQEVTGLKKEEIEKLQK